ncbi:MAG: hypothetical protein AMXMBFR77_26580 [Phycisphaerales bacterium]
MLTPEQMRRCQKLAEERKRRVLSVIHSRGRFDVSWRYRDEPLMRTCKSLCKQGVLRLESNRAGCAVFVAARQPTPPTGDDK